MTRLLATLSALFLLVGATLPANADESPLPERRLQTAVGQDFYGGDIGSILETTFKNCRQVCMNNPACKALTFNTRAGACFLKSEVERVEAFEGAISARIIDLTQDQRTRAKARRAELGFITDAQIRNARSLAAVLGGRVAAVSSDPDQIRQNAINAQQDGNKDLAAQNFASVVTVTDAPDDWRDLARAWAVMNPKKSSDKRRFNRDALSATINAYLRSETTNERATALNMIARMLERNGRAKMMIPALRLSLQLSKRRDTEDMLDYALSRYGFRVVGHTVDSESVSARMCVQFSEKLADAGIDYAPYVSVDGHPNLPVEANGQDLCVDGLEHGKRYKMSVRDGLPSAKGEALRSASRIEAYVKDRSASVRFTGKSYVLPKSPSAAIPIVTVNMSEVDVEIYRVGERNLIPMIRQGTIDELLNNYMANEVANETGTKVWTGKADIVNRVNADVTTALPIGDAVTKFEPGIYAMVAKVPGDKEEWNRKATQWFIVTDLGLQAMTGADGVHGFVRSLATAEPIANAKVQLIAKNNTVLGTGITDDQGYLNFRGGLTRGRGGDAPAMLTVERQGDFAFLDLSKPGFDLSDRGVSGRKAPGPVDVFATTERGVYRPGEIVHLTALARNGTANAIDDLPLTVVVTRPDGVEYHRALINDQGAGGRSHSIRLGHGVPRGSWSLAIHTDPKAPAVRQLAFLVEDFVPEKIDFDLAAPDGMIDRDTPVEIALNVRYLYGAPGADLPVDGQVKLTAANELPGFKGYSFGLANERVDPIFDSLGRVTTDANGDAVLALKLPTGNGITKPMDVTAIVQVTDSSGRPVERTIKRPLSPGTTMIGVRPNFDGQAPEGGTVGFDIVAVDAQGKQTDMPRVGWTLSKVNRNWQWYVVDGRWNWEAIVSREKVASGTVTLTADGRARVESGVKWGEYELKLVNLEGEPATASYEFSAGWYSSGAKTDTPDILEVGLDKDQYRIGETMQVRLKPRYAGKVLISVVDNRMIDMKTIDVQPGETSVDLTVTEEWGPGAYVTATLIRPMNGAAKQNASRALGLAWAEVDPEDRKLDVAFLTPDEVAPRGPLNASVLVAGMRPGERAYVTVAAVDLGILNLTAFKSPSPTKHYYGQRALGMEMRDLYGNLIDGLQGAAGRLRSGGDAEQARLKSIPPVEELVAYFSGVVEVGPDGVATVEFEVPDFNGTVRLMATAWTANAVGDAERDILVRDPIVVSAATPRFLAPRDVTRVLVDVAHAKGPAGDVLMSIESDGGLSIAGDPIRRIFVDENGIQRISIPVTAVEIGNPRLTLRTTTPGGQQLVKNLTLPVRLNDPEIARRSDLPLATGGRLTIDRDTFAGYEPETARVTVGVGPVAQFDAPGLLVELDRYPYGCTEQTTSRALPLLYLDQVATALGMDKRKEVSKRIADAIERVLERQAPSGSFGLWRPGSDDLWLDAYVTDFLSRAKAQGHKVPPIPFTNAIDNLRSALSYSSDFKSGGEAVAYALMVLAREGAASIGDLRYFADAKAEAFATPLAKAQLGAALAFYGEQRRADRMFRLAEQHLMGQANEVRGYRYDYGSHLRDGAAVIALAAEARTNAINLNRLVNVVAERRTARWTSTQEKAWMLMATHAMLDRVSEGLTLNGKPVTGPMIRLFNDDDVTTGAITIGNTGASTRAVVTTYGVPIDPEPAGGNGYSITRSYFTMDGVPVSPTSVAQNDRLVVLITVSSLNKRNARLVIDDPLPAGFEIDNPNLLETGSIASLKWLKTSATPQHAEFRSDRFLAAVNKNGKGDVKLAYIVRAVSPGLFHYPAAIVEDMYRPEFRAWTDTGAIEVVEAR